MSIDELNDTTNVIDSSSETPTTVELSAAAAPEHFCPLSP